MDVNKSRHTCRRITLSALAVVVLTICLCITTYALVTVTVNVDNNYFKMGNVEINLNDGQAIINENDFRFEPGMTVTKSFFVKNESTDSVWYKIYFENVKGDLADVLQITIKQGEKIIAQGTANQLNRNAVSAKDDKLALNEKRDLTISFYYPQDAGNTTQSKNLEFSLCAEAVQTRNNDDKAFE